MLSSAPLSPVSTLVDCLSSGTRGRRPRFLLRRNITNVYSTQGGHFIRSGDPIRIRIFSAASASQAGVICPLAQPLMFLGGELGRRHSFSTLSTLSRRYRTPFSLLSFAELWSTDTEIYGRSNARQLTRACRSTHPSARRALFRGAIDRALLCRIRSHGPRYPLGSPSRGLMRQTLEALVLVRFRTYAAWSTAGSHKCSGKFCLRIMARVSSTIRFICSATPFCDRE
ncbi:hypothetical protein EDB84DRAFT_247981 [Lactarius hengduanensis]|nr:hypothetical protein EDB84DRAFT_247981 [Lactarius hengduanensis]